MTGLQNVTEAVGNPAVMGALGSFVGVVIGSGISVIGKLAEPSVQFRYQSLAGQTTVARTWLSDQVLTQLQSHTREIWVATYSLETVRQLTIRKEVVFTAIELDMIFRRRWSEKIELILDAFERAKQTDNLADAPRESCERLFKELVLVRYFLLRRPIPDGLALLWLRGRLWWNFD